jgi:hypothetical protein
MKYLLFLKSSRSFALLSYLLNFYHLLFNCTKEKAIFSYNIINSIGLSMQNIAENH